MREYKSYSIANVGDNTTADYYMLEGIHSEILLEELGEYCDAVDQRQVRHALQRRDSGG
jgi:phage terminase large subunit-like protein